MAVTCDKNGVPFRVGDLLKVSVCNDKEFCKFQQITRQDLVHYSAGRKVLFFFVDILDLKASGYLMRPDAGIQEDCEIIQSFRADHLGRRKIDELEGEQNGI